MANSVFSQDFYLRKKMVQVNGKFYGLKQHMKHLFCEQINNILNRFLRLEYFSLSFPKWFRHFIANILEATLTIEWVIIEPVAALRTWSSKRINEFDERWRITLFHFSQIEEWTNLIRLNRNKWPYSAFLPRQNWKNKEHKNKNEH